MYLEKHNQDFTIVIKPECLYRSQILILNRKAEIENTEKIRRENKIKTKILDPKLTDEQYTFTSKQEIKQSRYSQY